MIGHRLLDDGQVLVTLKQSWGTAFAAMPESTVKRFAWGLLADLDPDGVDKVRTGSAHKSGAGRSLRERRPGAPSVLPHGAMVWTDEADEKLIRLVREGGRTLEAIGAQFRPARTRGSVAGRIDRLRRARLLP